MDTMVKANLEKQIALLEQRVKLENWGVTGVMLYFILLLEIVPYFQQYSMLNKWHSLQVLVRISAYAGLLLLKYVLSKRIEEGEVGRHLAYLKQLVGQMQ